jgi:hypothetical protein
MSDEKDVPQAMAALMLGAESGSSTCSKDLGSFDEDEKADIALVEERLLSFYSKQLDQPPHKRRASLKKVEPPPIHKPHAYPCRDTHSRLPSPPTKWPQRPVMLRPSPNTSTVIRGIRKANEKEYQHYSGFCAGCILPINTGRELPGESFAIDFENRHFCGTALFRIKNVPEVSTSCGATSYFDGKKRKFQAVVKGKFKTPLKMSECVTGQLFDRPAGRLPAKWIVTSFIKVVSVLAPQLEASLDAQEPRFLSPLVATAHTVLEKDAPSCGETQPPISTDENENRLYNYQVYAGAADIEDDVEEPSAESSMSVMKHVHGSKDAGSVAKRQKVRKKAYNHIFASKAEEPCFQLDMEYTFEFYQHLLLFDDSLAIDMGRIGHVDLAPVTNGQPIKFMSAHKDSNTGELDMLWSFDIWHESLYSYAQAAEGEE